MSTSHSDKLPTANLASKLVPNGAETGEQFRAAWDLLKHRPEAAAEERAHALCFLTYQTIAGKVKFDDWVSNIKSLPVGEIPEGGLRSRWIVSQAAAECYLYGVRGDVEKAEAAALVVVEQCLAKNAIDLCPGASTSFLRVQAIRINCLILDGHEAQLTLARDTLSMSVEVWRRAKMVFDWAKHPYHWTEMRDDLRVMQALTFMAAKLGMTHCGHRSWMSMEKLMQEDGHMPWMRALKGTSIHKNAMWLKA